VSHSRRLPCLTSCARCSGFGVVPTTLYSPPPDWQHASARWWSGV
jgi:hypothetical protein